MFWYELEEEPSLDNNDGQRYVLLRCSASLDHMFYVGFMDYVLYGSEANKKKMWWQVW